MVRRIERLAEFLLVLVSVVMACIGNWPAAQYFIMVAGVVELDEWVNH